MTSSGVYLAALRWIFCEFPLKHVLLQVSTSSLDQYLSGLITQFTSMINLDLVVGSLDDFISDITSVCWSIFLHLLHFKEQMIKKFFQLSVQLKLSLLSLLYEEGRES